MPDFKLGGFLDGYDDDVRMPPPVVFRSRPDSYVVLKAPEQLRARGRSVRQTTGLEIVAGNLAGVAPETGCSYGEASHSDDCGMA
ncbi:hypothetical protein ACFY40_29720 [Streptomyces sp. NPDC012950]|uniref:hypothetical protein n=1 Tax=Streptomyces sp. NPDC012950 TaxID=3364858 RepID=UPI0036C095FD